jgi:hypothetical protein
MARQTQLLLCFVLGALCSALLQLYLLEWECSGFHPFVSGGVLLPPLLQLCERELRAVDAPRTRVLGDAACAISALWRGGLAVENRPNIPAPAAAAILATPPPSNATLQEQSPMARLDSDSLTLVFSFLCGCDFLKALRVNRRWLQFRFKPAAWPSYRPCGAHMPRLLSVFRTLLSADCTTSAASMMLSSLDGRCVRMLLEGGVLTRVVALMDSSESLLQFTALMILSQFGYVEQGTFIPRMADAHGVMPAVLPLLRSPAEFVQAKATTTLATLCSASPSHIEAVMRDGAVPVIMEQIRKRDPSLFVGHPAAALASIALAGSDYHRLLLLHEGFLPLLSAFTLRYGNWSVKKPPQQRMRNEAQELSELLTALARMVSTEATNTTTTTTTALDGLAWTGDCVSVIAQEQCGPVEQWRPLLDHWNPGVCEAMERFLRECYAQ